MKKGGEIIREYRIKKNLTLKELASSAGVNYVFLSKIERNMEIPSEDLITRLAKCLDYKGDISELVATFGKVPDEIKKLIIEDPSSVVSLPAFFKSRQKKK